MISEASTKLLNKLFLESEKFRDDAKGQTWKENLKWLKGDQTIGQDGLADTVTNFIFSQIMTMVPVLTGSMPEVTPKAVNTEHEPHAELLGKLILRIFKRNDFIRKQQRLVTNGMISGKSYFKPVWDKRMFQGRGDISIRIPSHLSLSWQKGRDSVERALYLFEKQEVDKLTLLSMFPGKKMRPTIDSLFSKGTAAPEMTEGDGTTTEGRHASGPGEAEATTMTSHIFDVAQNSERTKEKIDLVECWFLDNEVLENTLDILSINEKGEAKTSKEDKETLRFPTGRLVVQSGGIPLDDRPNPFHKFPYIEYENYYMPGEPWGMDEIMQIRPLQEQFNVRMNQLMDAMNFTNHKQILVDQTAGVDVDEFTNRPGGVIPVDDVNGVKIIDYGGPNSAQFESLVLYQRLIEVISGIREVSQGEVPGDVRSGFAIEQLQEASLTRLRLKTRLIEDSIKRLSRYLTYLIGAFYIPGTHYPDAENLNLEGITPDMFDFDVKAGVSVSNSKQALQQLIQWGFVNSVFDEEYVVDNLDVPDRDDLKERMLPQWNAKKQAAQTQLEQAGQPQPQGSPNVVPLGG